VKDRWEGAERRETVLRLWCRADTWEERRSSRRLGRKHFSPGWEEGGNSQAKVPAKGPLACKRGLHSHRDLDPSWCRKHSLCRQVGWIQEDSTVFHTCSCSSTLVVPRGLLFQRGTTLGYHTYFFLFFFVEAALPFPINPGQLPAMKVNFLTCSFMDTRDPPDLLGAILVVLWDTHYTLCVMQEEAMGGGLVQRCWNHWMSGPSCLSLLFSALFPAETQAQVILLLLTKECFWPFWFGHCCSDNT
jgi:hypothetical protein